MVRVVDALPTPCIEGACGDRERDVTNMIFSDVFRIKKGDFVRGGNGAVPSSSESIPHPAVLWSGVWSKQHDPLQKKLTPNFHPLVLTSLHPPCAACAARSPAGLEKCRG